MTFFRRCTALLLLCAFAGTVQAHFYVENPSCRAPKKPLQFVTDLDKQEFDQKVQEYRGCLEAFVNKQNDAMAIHKQSADKASEIWKNYVEQVLGQKIKDPNAEAPTDGAPAEGTEPTP